MRIYRKLAMEIICYGQSLISDFSIDPSKRFHRPGIIETGLRDSEELQVCIFEFSLQCAISIALILESHNDML
jgi:hypothetical protein